MDNNKRKSNLSKHGVDFRDAAKVLKGYIVEENDQRSDYGSPVKVVIEALNYQRSIVVMNQVPNGS
ncbi:MAG: hypothetical protein BRC40_10795 [Cyanobacteria bacterium QH_8_48_120]|nr:MAG: hypothetical protein BRC40_10795 [Cyanobacteria bacterium QH_8_48_120]